MIGDRVHKNTQPDPVVAVATENLQAGLRIRAILEHHASILRLFQKGQIRAKGKIRGAHRTAGDGQGGG